MFDPAMVINDVQQNRHLPDWRVIRGNGRAGLFIALAVLILCTGVCVAGTLGGFVLLLSAMLAASHFVAVSSTWWISLLVALPMIGLASWLAIWFLRRSQAEGRSLLVLLPDGTVECYCGKIDNITALHFDSIQNVNMDHRTAVSGFRNGSVNSTITYWLNVYDHRGGYMKWVIHNCYGDPAVIAGNIIAAYQHHQRHQQQYMQHP